MVGRSGALRYVRQRSAQVAPTSTTVLLQGETGVGKELVAHALHGLSPRARAPAHQAQLRGAAASLVESELFGHEKGAFTGAVALRKGRFEIADGGTLFLDEIGELPLELQAKLLRVIQDGEFERVGGTATIKTDVRLIAATNRRARRGGRRRAASARTLLPPQRLPDHLPPLRERREDVPLLVQHFVEKHCRKLGSPCSRSRKGRMHDLQAHDWPGNVRELETVIERAVISSAGPALRVSEPTLASARPSEAARRTLERDPRRSARR